MAVILVVAVIIQVHNQMLMAVQHVKAMVAVVLITIITELG